MTAKQLEYALLGVLALLWGSSYMWIDLGLATIPPVTLIAIRVSLAAAFLVVVLALRGMRLPTDGATWRSFFIQSLLNSTGPWTLLAFGQQSVDSSVASVLNSTSPLWVFLFSILLVQRANRPGALQLLGALFGIGGIVLIVGTSALATLGEALVPQGIVLFGAMLYGLAALRGRSLSHLPSIVTATGTLLCAAAVMIPLSLVADRPWQVSFSAESLGAVAVLGIACTAFAFLIYFRLLGTLGSMETASQAYLRSGVGVGLGVFFLGEVLDVETFFGICLAIAGVVLINWPRRKRAVGPAAKTEAA